MTYKPAPVHVGQDLFKRGPINLPENLNLIPDMAVPSLDSA
jgi:hypothetical protein